MTLKDRINELFEQPPETYSESHHRLFNTFKAELNAGRIRAAEPKDGQWKVNLWVKRGILLGFRLGQLQDFSINSQIRFFDKHTFPPKPLKLTDEVRLVPGGSVIREGAYVGRGVICMPPMYINVGAYVDEGTMVDSHALVGSCAQIGKRVHLSAGAQIGGVLEPVGELPVIIEDDVLVGGNTGIYEGTIVRRRAIVGAGVVLTGSTPVFDLVRQQILQKQPGQPLEIPEGAVVIPGARAITKGWGAEQGLSIQTPLIVKYRDEKTDAAVSFEELLR